MINGKACDFFHNDCPFITRIFIVFNPEKSLPHLRENRKADDAQILKKMNELEPMVDDNHKKVL